MGKAYTPERLARTHRMRKARRLFKQTPLFAFALMQQHYPQYTYDEFWDDLRRRTKKKQKRHKTPLTRYGRYARMQQLLRQYGYTKDTSLLREAVKLRERMAKPYRVMARVGGEGLEFTFSPLVQIHAIEQLTLKISQCKSKQEVTQVVEQFRETENFR